MKSQDILYSEGKNDECLTPIYAIKPLLKYISKDKTIWCPFDLPESNFIKLFIENGNNVICSHIDMGIDFLNCIPPKDYDYIISNPPFTNKRKFFEKCIELKKPFLLLAPCTWFNDSALSNIFKDEDMQILFFNKRIKFENKGVIENKITFASCFIGKGILPKQIIFEYL